jgi:GT2 family glycosyltransferase
MALITIAVWDTEENKRSALTQRTLTSLYNTVDFHKHRLVIVDNGSCPETKSILREWNTQPFEIITLSENIGTAKAINKAWVTRHEGEHAVKMDNDVVIHQENWLDILVECVEREPKVGIVGLKRTDCIETPWNPADWYRSELKMLPHDAGQRWLVVERVHHVMGTCQLYSSACLDKIGYLYQMDELYGFDDALASIRAQVAGFMTVHYPHILIDHIDPGGEDPYTAWKKQVSDEAMGRFNAERMAFMLGHKPVWCDPE